MARLDLVGVVALLMVTTTSTSRPAVEQVSMPNRRGAVAQRVCIVSDDLSGVADEGVKKFTVAIAAALRGEHRVGVISTKGPTASPGVTCVPAPRTFLSRSLRAELGRQNPDILIYAARGSATYFSFLRSRILKAYRPQATVVLLGLQTRRHSSLQQKMIRRLAPDLVCVQSPANRDYLESLGCRVELLPSGVDTETFRPVGARKRRELRTRYGLDPDLPVVLHVGHLTGGRRIDVLAELATRKTCQVVLVGSSSTEQEAELGEELRRAGVVVLTEYQPHIEHLYQLADCYVFPVESTNNAIEAPLSVLEALACGVPVVTTRFGALPRMFAAQPQEQSCLVFVDSGEQLVDEAVRMCGERAEGARELVLPCSWRAVATAVLDQALRVRGAKIDRASGSVN
ncbi:MAG: glycosyltransferase family 4 protein [Chloroflexota bacterium]|nr:glycosyltransferase family 4 protein [Chloroflexota bacterium]